MRPNETHGLLGLTTAVQTYLLRTRTLVVRTFQHEAARITMGERDARFMVYGALLSGGTRRRPRSVPA